ncbi:MAG: SAM-dependent methyltransferase [Afipia broomeae]|jgi:SAM-dependent methyltransferase
MPITSDHRTTEAERQRIAEVYAQRDRTGTQNEALLASVAYAQSVKHRLFAGALRAAGVTDLSELRIADIGCGTGAFLRSLCEWGAVPANLTGVEYLPDRIERARTISHPDIQWVLGDLSDGTEGQFDLTTANLVFSSILDAHLRNRLATEMWDRTLPGGLLMIFDFRYDNPSNPNVRKVTAQEMTALWPGTEVFRQTGLLLPPLVRRMTGSGFTLAEALTRLFPFLRSHFLLCVRKPLTS